MCTMEGPKPVRLVNKSIIIEINPTKSCGSDYVSDDDHISSSRIDVSTQTTSPCCPHKCCNTISEDISQNIPPCASRSPRDYRHFSRDPVYSCSPSPCHRMKDQLHVPIKSHRSHSVEHLPLPKLVRTPTNDSGTEESMVHLPSPPPTNTEQYEIVPVFGQPEGKVVIMVNRYDFDPTKVQEYRRQTSRNPLKPSRRKSSHQLVVTNTRPNRTTSTQNLPTTKSDTFLSSLIRVFKPSSTDRYPNEPIIRHHSSHIETNEHH